jgi:hypothetical protein
MALALQYLYLILMKKLKSVGTMVKIIMIENSKPKTIGK